MPQKPKPPRSTLSNRKQPSRRLARYLERRAINQARFLAAQSAGPPEDIDEMRFVLARRIAVFIGNRQGAWRTCPQRGCRRARACLAPRIRCSNAPPRQPDADGRRLAWVQAMVSRALRQAAGRAVSGEGGPAPATGPVRSRPPRGDGSGNGPDRRGGS